MSEDIGVIYDSTLHMPHYVNGRLLSAEDLAADQQAVLERLAALGQGAGAGVVYGLWVNRVDAARVRIYPGLGINQQGDLVRLSDEPVTLAVNVQADEDDGTEDAGRFADCGTPGGTIASPEGAYLLVARPTSKLEGSVPVKSVASRGQTAECASKWAVEGVRFRVIRLKDFPVIGNENGQKRRSRLAHWCYGSANLRTLVQYPFTFQASYSGLDQLSSDVLAPCDLPLAVFYWDANGITFVDNWPARRRLVHTYPADEWGPLISDKREAEGEARFLQFQEHLPAVPNKLEAKATGMFAFLPPVGFLPIRPPQRLINRMIVRLVQALRERAPNISITDAELIELVSDRVNSVLDDNLWAGAFDIDTFFDGVTLETVYLADRYPVEARLNQSWFEQAIDLAHRPTVELYILYEDLTLFITAAFLKTLEAATVNAIGLVATAAPATVATPAVQPVRQPGAFARMAMVAPAMSTFAVNAAAANAYELGWGLTEAHMLWNQPEPIITSAPQEPEVMVAWDIVRNAASDILGLDRAIVDFGVKNYNVVRMYAMFVQAESDVEPIAWRRGQG